MQKLKFGTAPRFRNRTDAVMAAGDVGTDQTAWPLYSTKAFAACSLVGGNNTLTSTAETMDVAELEGV